MQTITNITSQIGKKTKLPQEQIKKILTSFLEVTKQKLLQGEVINFKGYFTLKRSTTKPTGVKHCSKHEKAFTDYKKANKGKGLVAYAKSAQFRKLINDTKNCKDCQNKNQQLIKNAKPLNRISFKVSKGFWSKSRR